MNDPLINDINDAISEEIAKLTVHIASGNLVTFEDYKKRTGVILGLKLALEIVSGCSKKFLSGEDDENT